ncbi:MAG: ricin-type beta-trefoil lectin domain protein [Rhodoferax sp.]|nr:ricin-type beta-trefoil lectin domain protein [Rhodoferax sp.]
MRHIKLGGHMSRRTSHWLGPLLVLATTLSASAHAGFLTAMQIKTLPEQQYEQFTSRIPAVVADAKSRPVSQKINAPDQVIVAPITYHWSALELGSGRAAFPPLWANNEHSGSVQWLTDETQNYILDGLRERGYDAPLTSDSLKNQGMNVDALGYEPNYSSSADSTGVTMLGYTYISGKLKKWLQKDFGVIQDTYPGIKTIIFIDIGSYWDYKGHGQLNREAVVNYNVSTAITIKICALGKCTESKIPRANPLVTTLFIPAEVPDEESRRKENNASAVKLAGKFYADAVLAIIDNMVNRPEGARAGATATSTRSDLPKSAMAIVSRMNEKCVDVPAGNFVAGTAVHMWDCYPGHKNQTFELTSDNQIKAGGLCLNALGGTGNNGDSVGLWQCMGAPNEKWILQDGYIKGIKGRCLNIDGFNAANGASLIIWDCQTNATNDRWILQDVKKP